MRIASFLSTICAAALVVAEQRTAQIYVQAIQSSPSLPQPLAEIAYDAGSLISTEVVSYEAPELPETASLVRVGIYDPKSEKWIAGTTAASMENFDRGYAPTILLSVDESGDVRSVTLKGVRVDAGQTRDFGPKAIVIADKKGSQPELNKPVILSPGGRKAEEEEPKSFLQKYWWLIAIVVVMSLAGGEK
ncbi:hypothetical protein NXS19_001784 [Fusarium pseudograminearum]|uniref:ER membrane protein complex subunit 10 n=1 Tax=Fusarium pseudograminearum (strain CS3096) TaxID=1028729 RepID=K3UHK0_FUSPC|nr:hypothetical protein FPSE_08515 [Fusarium pseudograminearum CS3096]EKJ71276.1 hypothetical protein FPSE_08515 [Fusarium pseudograminearum CS3096]KAF0640451.1 hypothetical protein FPSE5266_08515 [Fusarium pseudograminearum]UZP33968.1 hypothetical protein NXS19_001784 [Fusarium pseudograminearum]